MSSRWAAKLCAHRFRPRHPTHVSETSLCSASYGSCKRRTTRSHLLPNAVLLCAVLLGAHSTLLHTRTDRRTPDRYIDPAPHTMRTVSTISARTIVLPIADAVINYHNNNNKASHRNHLHYTPQR